jgi:hypothetical protein
MIEDLIASREAELSRVNDPAEHRRIERELVFLREELGRLP